jgi:hypothetical protein
VHNIDTDGCGPPENWEKNFRGPLHERSPTTFDQRSPNTTSEAEFRIVAEGVAEAEAHTHRDLYTTCTATMKPTVATKIAPFTLIPNGKWTKKPLNLHHNHHTKRLTTPCSGPHTTSNSHHLTPRHFHHRHTKTAKPKLQSIINHTITPPLAILNLCQFHK